jgi:hypothetical protein
MVHKVWGQPQEAEKASSWVQRTGIALHNISPDDRLIWIKPGETILAHTVCYLICYLKGEKFRNCDFQREKHCIETVDCVIFTNAMNRMSLLVEEKQSRL